MRTLKNIRFISSILSAIAITAALAPAPVSAADTRGDGFLMFEDPASPKNVSMGSVGTALGGAGIRYYNPVMPFFAGGSYVTGEFGMLPGEVTKGGFETALIFREFFSAMSFYSSSVGWETRDERGFGFPATSATTIGAASFGYIRGNMSAGVGLTMAEDRIWYESRYTAFALSGGLGYRLFDGKLNLGAAGFHGLAWSKGFGGPENAAEWHDGRVPRFARGGAAWGDTLKSVPYTVAADVVYRDEDKTFTVPVGIDVRVLPILNLRVGKRIGWDDEVMSFGVGLNIDRISFDAAFVPAVFVDDYEMKWSMAFTYRLGPSKRKEVVFPPVNITGDGGDATDVDTVGADAPGRPLPDDAETSDDSEPTMDSGDVVDTDGVVDDNRSKSDDGAETVAPESTGQEPPVPESATNGGARNDDTGAESPDAEPVNQESAVPKSPDPEPSVPESVPDAPPAE